MAITATGAEDKEEFLSLVRKAESECSVFATISKVSEMEVNVDFV